jgi:hypothetical protein
LHCRIKRAEKTGPILLGQRSGSVGIRSQLPQVAGYFTTGKRISYIRLRPLFAYAAFVVDPDGYRIEAYFGG